MTDDPITRAARATVDAMRRRVEAEMAKSVYTSSEPNPAPDPAFDLKTVALAMARAVFDADVVISEFTPAPDKNGKVVECYVIDNTFMPWWSLAQEMCVARGEPPAHAKTIVFPSVENALRAVDAVLAKRKEGKPDET
jgi:hypothetical protein